MHTKAAMDILTWSQVRGVPVPIALLQTRLCIIFCLPRRNCRILLTRGPGKLARVPSQMWQIPQGKARSSMVAPGFRRRATHSPEENSSPRYQVFKSVKTGFFVVL